MSNNKYNKSTETVLEKQLQDALYRNEEYYEHDTYDTYDVSNEEEKTAEMLIEMMEIDPSNISNVAYNESSSIIAEIIRQLLLR
jgi:hypothetical protein